MQQWAALMYWSTKQQWPTIVEGHLMIYCDLVSDHRQEKQYKYLYQIYRDPRYCSTCSHIQVFARRLHCSKKEANKVAVPDPAHHLHFSSEITSAFPCERRCFINEEEIVGSTFLPRGVTIVWLMCRPVVPLNPRLWNYYLNSRRMESQRRSVEVEYAAAARRCAGVIARPPAAYMEAENWKGRPGHGSMQSSEQCWFPR